MSDRGGGGFEINGSGVRSVAGAMQDNADLAAKAGISLVGLAELLPAPPIGDRLTGSLTVVTSSWCDVVDDLVTAMTGLAGWLDGAVTSYFSVDTDTSYSFGAVHP